MKKLYFIIAFLLVNTCIFAQLNESFEGAVFPPSGWKMIDQDGDGYNWFQYYIATGNIAHTGTKTAASASWYNQVVLTPTNYLITPNLIVSSVSDSIIYWIAPQDKLYPLEHYEVKVSTSGKNPADFTTTLYSYTFTYPDTLVDWHRKAHSLSAFANDTVNIAFIHTACTDMFYLKLDDVTGPAIYSLSNDMEVTSVIVPTGIVYPGNINLKAYLKNNGNQTQAAGKVITFYNGTTIIGTATTSDSIVSGAIDSVTYIWANAPAGSFVIKAEVANDQDNSNNFSTANLSIYPLGSYIESFENIAALPPLGWSNPGTWLLGTNPIYAYEGTQYAYVPASYVDTKLITPKIQVVAGDSITFMAFSLATTLYPTVKVQYSADKVNWTDVAGADFTMTGIYTKYVANITFSGAYYFAFVGTNNSTASLRLDFVVAPAIVPTLNIAVTQMTAPSSACMLTNNEQVTAVISNAGLLDAYNFQISYQKNLGQPVTETVTDTVFVGNYLVYDFATKVDLSIAGTDSIRFWITAINDDDQQNDTLNYTEVNNLPALNAPVSMGFEAGEDLSGWILKDMNGDANSWSLGNTTGLSNTGTNYAVYNYNTTTPADDWLISRCYNISTTHNPYLSFYYRAMDTYPEKMNVYLMTSTEISDTLIKLVDLPDITNITYNQSITPFSVPATGVYYIGFHAYSNADMWRLLLDDMVVGINASVNENSKDVVFNVFPNPAIDLISFTSNYTIKQIELYNTIGQKIIDINPNTYYYQLNSSNLPKGVYFVKATTVKGQTTSKLIIK